MQPSLAAVTTLYRTAAWEVMDCGRRSAAGVEFVEGGEGVLRCCKLQPPPLMAFTLKAEPSFGSVPLSNKWKD